MAYEGVRAQYYRRDDADERIYRIRTFRNSPFEVVCASLDLWLELGCEI